MKVKIGKKEYIVSWQYFRNIDENCKEATICSIHLLIKDKKKIVRGARAKLHPKDNSGRKVSFTRALLANTLVMENEKGFDKETRTIFWNEYHKIWNYGKH